MTMDSFCLLSSIFFFASPLNVNTRNYAKHIRNDCWRARKRINYTIPSFEHTIYTEFKLARRMEASHSLFTLLSSSSLLLFVDSNVDPFSGSKAKYHSLSKYANVWFNYNIFSLSFVCKHCLPLVCCQQNNWMHCLKCKMNTNFVIKRAHQINNLALSLSLSLSFGFVCVVLLVIWSLFFQMNSSAYDNWKSTIFTFCFVFIPIQMFQIVKKPSFDFVQLMKWRIRLNALKRRRTNSFVVNQNDFLWLHSWMTLII